MSYKITREPDITHESIRRNAQRWLTIMRYGEYGVIIQPQDDCEYRVDQIIQDSKLLKEVLGPYYRKYLFGYVPVDKKQLMTVIKETLVVICVERKIEIPEESSSVKKLIDYVGKKGYEIGLFIARIDDLLTEPGFQTLLELEYLLENTLNFSVIVFSEEDITHPKYSTLVDKCSLLFDHIIKFPLYSEKDCRQFIRYNNSMWNMKLPKKLENQIIMECGGYLWLISHLQRFIRDNPNASIEDALQDEGLLLKLENIFQKFTPRQQELMIKTHDDLLSDGDRKTHEYKYLISIKFIKENGQKPLMGIPLLSLVIEKEKSLRQIELREGKFFIAHNPIDALLTDGERKFLTLLLIKQRKIVTRDELAKKLWGGGWEEKYSDWAIDKLAFRLRKKLTQLGLKNELLKTVKRKGFLLG